MKKLMLSLLAISCSLSAFAQSGITTNTGDLKKDDFISRFGANYFTFYDGPSLADGREGRNELGRPINGNDGFAAFNNISIVYRINERINFDHQTRLEYVHSEQREWRFQGMRVGISGKLLSGERWSLKGAFNTDVPELNGDNERSRTTIFNPGLFAGFNYQIDDRWSFYSILTPRVYFYRDDEAVEERWRIAGRDPGEKRRVEIRLSPTLNYAINDNYGIRSGLDLQFMNLIKDDFGEFTRFPTTAVTLGPTIAVSKMLNLYVFARTFPFDGLKARRETTSFGAWINGVLF
jgi:hypothetical protein